MIKLLVIQFLFNFININNGENILALLGCPSPSHHIWNTRLLQGIASKGHHNITVLSVDVDKNAPTNIHYIHLEKAYDALYVDEHLDLIELNKAGLLESVDVLYEFGISTCKGIMKSTGLQTLLNYPKDFKFDAIIYDSTVSPCLIGFLHKFNYPPLISVTPFNNPPTTVDLIGGHNYHAYIPYCALYYNMNMNFWQRLNNILVHAYDHFHRKYTYLPTIERGMENVFDIENLSIEELERKTVLALVNTFPAVNYPQPLPPNVIEVGGLQIKPSKPLPKDLEDFVQSSKKGAILFSLGSNLRSDQLDKTKQKIILSAFEQIPEYNFLWKFESALEDLPKNVLIKPWLPQTDILAHNLTKAFITHAGTLSTQESTWFGVPMIGIPFFIDQHTNLFKSTEAGVAEKITFATMTTDSLVKAILKVVNTPSYSANMKLRSSRFRDQPQTPIDRAVWWVEYILRNPNPDHLRSPVLELGFIVSNSFDVAIFFTLISLCILIVAFKVIRKIMNILDNLGGGDADKKKKN